MIADPTLNLVVAAAIFLFSHIGISSSRLRGLIVGRIGENAYTGVYSLIALIVIVWFCMAYNRASAETFTLLWVAEPWLWHLSMILILLAAMLVVIGFVVKNPTAAGALVDEPDVAKGILRVTRHPFLWGVQLWSIAHIAVNGDLSSLIFFGTFAVLALIGPPLIDAKRAQTLGARWEAYAAQTSNLPFGAIITGRNSFNIREIGLVWPLVGVALYLVLLIGHGWLFGVSPLPPG